MLDDDLNIYVYVKIPRSFGRYTLSESKQKFMEVLPGADTKLVDKLYDIRDKLKYSNYNENNNSIPLEPPKQEEPPKPEEISECAICMDSDIETCFLECGHSSCCQSCSINLTHCPICREVITRVVRVFRTQ